MTRLNMIVEGQTEEQFVHSVLKDHLAEREVWVYVRCVETSRDRRSGKIYRGGTRTYLKAKKDIERWLKEQGGADVRFTTMFDLYHLPKDFPGVDAARRQSDPLLKVAAIETALRTDITDHRFLPYIQLHEFEALLFSDAAKLEWEFIEHQAAIAALTELAQRFPTPEHIDEHDPPSKRLITAIPEYEGLKPSAGPLVASKIGLATLRDKCKHFDEWVARLEQL